MPCDVRALADWAERRDACAGFRLFACAKVEGMLELAAQSREIRPVVDIERVGPASSGLDALGDAASHYFCTHFRRVGRPTRREPALREHTVAGRDKR